MVDTIKKDYLFTNKRLIALIIPLIIEQFLAMTVGMADSMMVASVGESAVSAVSLVDSINMLLINIFAALSTGGAVIAGQFIGQKDNKKACEAGEQLIKFVSIISLIIMALMYVSKGFILNNVFGDIEFEVANHANTYLLIVFLSIPFIAIYNSGAALFRAMGNSRITMITSLIMNGINVVGNAILIFGFKMGVAGAAIPTLISRIIAAVIIMILLKEKSLNIHINNPFKTKYNGPMVKNILHLGIPNGIENSMFQLGRIMLLSIISSLGTASITANAVAGSFSGIQILPSFAIGFALLTVVSQCVGAKDFEQARYYTKKLLQYAYIIMIVFNALIFFALPSLLSLYNLSIETYTMARQVIIFHGVFACLLWPLAFTLPNTLRAANDVKYTMLVSVITMWTVRIALGIILVKYTNIGMFGVWVAMICDWVVRTVFFLSRYKGHKWETIRFIKEAKLAKEGC